MKKFLRDFILTFIVTMSLFSLLVHLLHSPNDPDFKEGIFVKIDAMLAILMGLVVGAVMSQHRRDKIIWKKIDQYKEEFKDMYDISSLEAFINKIESDKQLVMWRYQNPTLRNLLITAQARIETIKHVSHA